MLIYNKVIVPPLKTDWIISLPEIFLASLSEHVLDRGYFKPDIYNFFISLFDRQSAGIRGRDSERQAWAAEVWEGSWSCSLTGLNWNMSTEVPKYKLNWQC